MRRIDIIKKVGDEYFHSNIENDEFSYAKALNRPISGHKYLDIRLANSKISILIETKQNYLKNFSENEKKQLFKYMELEKELTNNNTIGILFNKSNNNIEVYKNDTLLSEEKCINSFNYYVNLFRENKKNNRDEVLKGINHLNNKLHKYNIEEYLRSQFIGCLLVSLNSNPKLSYSSTITTNQILEGVKNKLEDKIDGNDNKKLKTELLIKILEDQNIKNLKSQELCGLLEDVENLMRHINDETTQGEDLLNLFFTTFNKYVGKKDKNQCFTPSHITDFMCEITNLTYRSRVLDPTCGSGAFLIQAMTKMLYKDEALNNEEVRKKIKSNQLFGIENDEKAFGLATTNMLIHQDGKSNIICSNCFEQEKWIKEKDIDIILMTPPFNAKKMPYSCPKNKKTGMDSTRGLFFVNYIANCVNKGVLATILPLQCAIGSDKSVNRYKKEIMKNHTLKAVFSLPDDVFYPGAAVNTCIMLFELGKPHNKENNTFFGYYKNDGFLKKKNMGRVEKKDWETTKKYWLEMFNEWDEKPGFSIKKNVSYNDEWLAEAYMETDYSKLNNENFIKTIRDYISFKVKYGDIDE